MLIATKSGNTLKFILDGAPKFTNPYTGEVLDFVESLKKMDKSRDYEEPMSVEKAESMIGAVKLKLAFECNKALLINNNTIVIDKEYLHSNM